MEFSIMSVCIWIGVGVAGGVFGVYIGRVLDLIRENKYLMRESMLYSRKVDELLMKVNELRENKEEADVKIDLFNRVIGRAYKMLDYDKKILCKSLNISKESYDKELDSHSGVDSGEFLEETLLKYRVNEVLLEAGYLYSKKFRERFGIFKLSRSGNESIEIECEECNDKIKRLVDKLKDLTQSDCRCLYERVKEE